MINALRKVAESLKRYVDNNKLDKHYDDSTKACSMLWVNETGDSIPLFQFHALSEFFEKDENNEMLQDVTTKDGTTKKAYVINIDNIKFGSYIVIQDLYDRYSNTTTIYVVVKKNGEIISDKVSGIFVCDISCPSILWVTSNFCNLDSIIHGYSLNSGNISVRMYGNALIEEINGRTNSKEYEPVDYYDIATKGYVDDSQKLKTERIEKTSTDILTELQPNVFYVFPEMTELTLTFAQSVDTSIVNEYHCIFTSGETATYLTIPDTIKIPDGMEIEANKVYEISVLENCLSYMSWDCTTEVTE